MKKIIQHLENSKQILLATHIEPDGDALGSLISMGLFLEAINKKTTLYCESPIPAIYRFLPGTERVVSTIDSISKYDTAIILDCGSLQRIGKMDELVGRVPTIINIDHHITNSYFGTYQFVETDSCATTALIYKLITVLGGRIDKDIAFSIYTGILTDTGSFRFSNTNMDSFAICEEMVSIGVDPHIVAQNVYGTYSLGRIKLLNLALDSLEISRNGKLSMMTLTESMLSKTDTQPEDVDGLINYAKRIEDVKVAVLLSEYPNGNSRLSNAKRYYHVSLRSDGSVDVAKIAALFEGGGHKTAAGFDIKTKLSDLKTDILNLSEKLSSG